MRRFISLMALLVCFWPLALAGAQDKQTTTIEARTLSTATGVFAIDKGLDDGLRSGDRVAFFPVGAPTLVGEISQLTERTANARLDQPEATLEAGVRCEIEVPTARLEAVKVKPAGKQPQAPAPKKPQPSPWKHGIDEWNADDPLLSAPRALAPSERETRWSGRAFASFDGIIDTSGGDRRTYTGRAGFDLRSENPFHAGGQLQVRASLNDYVAQLSDLPDDTRLRLRIDRLAYNWGGTLDTRSHWTVGRFLQWEFPELGVLDGGEFSLRLDGGHQIGTSAGFMPEPTLDYKTGEDFQGALFYRYTDEETGAFSAGLAYQKTWHDWKKDRDLFVANVRYRGQYGFNAYGTAWIDIYGSEDTAKSSSIELTQFLGSVGYTFQNGDGLNLALTHLRYPETLRTTVYSQSDSDLYHNDMQRLSLSGWHRFSDRVRGDARADLWRDADDTGGGGEVHVRIRDLPFERVDLDAWVFASDAQFVTTIGGRVSVSVITDVGYFNLMWETSDVDRHSVFAAGHGFQHRARFSWNHNVQSNFSVSLYVEQLLGESNDALSFGIYLQRTF